MGKIRYGTACVCVLALSLALVGCQSVSYQQPIHNAGEWHDLFNGRDLTGWHAPMNNWAAKNGVLVRKDFPKGTLDDLKTGRSWIWTAERYGDFVLDLEFKIVKGGNSGIFVRTGDIADPVQTGIEMQIVDSYNRAVLGTHSCGAIYNCAAPSKNAAKKAGEWNHVTLKCVDSRISVILNGERIVVMDLDRWTEPYKNPDGSKNKFRTAFRDMPRKGYIGLQDHFHPVWFRNIKIKRLD